MSHPRTTLISLLVAALAAAGLTGLRHLPDHRRSQHRALVVAAAQDHRALYAARALLAARPRFPSPAASPAPSRPLPLVVRAAPTGLAPLTIALHPATPPPVNPPAGPVPSIPTPAAPPSPATPTLCALIDVLRTCE